MSKKYEITKESKIVDGHTLYRIRALANFTVGPENDIEVYKGDLGGWIEKASNLSQKGNCWIANEAMAYGNSTVKDDALMTNNAKIYDNAELSAKAFAGGNVEIFGNAIVGDVGLHIYGSNPFAPPLSTTPCLYDNVKVFDNAVVTGNWNSISGNTNIYENARIIGTSSAISGNTKIHGDAQIEKCEINLDSKGDIDIAGKSTFYNCSIKGDFTIKNDIALDSKTIVNKKKVDVSLKPKKKQQNNINVMNCNNEL